jgi:hypothetical protein
MGFMVMAMILARRPSPGQGLAVPAAGNGQIPHLSFPASYNVRA